MSVKSQNGHDIAFENGVAFELEDRYIWSEPKTILNVTIGKSVRTVDFKYVKRLEVIDYGESKYADKRIRITGGSSGKIKEATISGLIWLGGDTEKHGRTRMHISNILLVEIEKKP